MTALARTIALCAVLAGASSAHAQQPASFKGCGGVNPYFPTITPTMRTTNPEFTNLGAECSMWQNFIYMNWPALPGQRGVPNPSATFGAPGVTVWESFKTVDQTFLPDGKNPGPWQSAPSLGPLPANLAQSVAAGRVRSLTMESKVSRTILANLAGQDGADAEILRDIAQVGGGILYDLNGRPVYYEIALNQPLYDFIVKNGLYDATQQVAYASKQTMTLPYPPSNSPPNQAPQLQSMELKAAWKILSPAEIRSGRFHTAQALIPGTAAIVPPRPVTVGLVGLHMYMPDPAQGTWATFAQIDNAPVSGQPVKGLYNFFNPNCTNCPVNVRDANPGQVMQMEPDDRSAGELNAYVQAQIRQKNPKSPWQYYKIVNIQWSDPSVAIPQTPPAVAPLPYGNPPNKTVVNAVLETFLQRPGLGCLTCHRGAQVPTVPGNTTKYATSYSFLFGHAKAPPSAK